MGIAGLGIQVRDPITGLSSWLASKTDASGYFTYSAIITGEGEYTYDFFFTGIPDNTKSIGSWTVKTKKSPSETSGFFDFSTYLTGTLVELSSTSTPSLGTMQTYMNVRRGFADGPADADSETFWVENTLALAQADTGITSKLDSGLYLLLYGTEGAAIGNGMTAKPGLTASPLLVHVTSGEQGNVITNLADFIDPAVVANIASGGIGVVAITVVNNKDEGSGGIGYDISLFADQQLDLLANLAGKIGVTFDTADDRTYGTSSTRLAKIVIGARTVGVRVGSFSVK